MILVLCQWFCCLLLLVEPFADKTGWPMASSIFEKSINTVNLKLPFTYSKYFLAEIQTHLTL